MNHSLSLGIFILSCIYLHSFPRQEVWPPPGSPEYMKKAKKNPEILELLRNKEYQELINLYESNSKIFDLPSEYTAIAIAYFTKGNHYNTVHLCAKSMQFRDYRSNNKCGRLTSQINKKDPGKYRLALADFYTEDKDYPAALVKYFRLIEDKIELESTRMGLIKIFKANNHPEFVVDQLQYLKQPSNIQSVTKYLKKKQKSYNKSYKNLSIEDLPRNNKSVYRMMILDGKPNEKFFNELVGLYEDNLQNKYSAETALRIANLYFLQKEFSRVRDVLGQLDFKIPELAQSFTLKDKLAYAALINRLPSKEQKSFARIISESSGKAGPTNYGASEEELPFDAPIIDRQKYKHFAPFDFTDVDMASNDNLEVFDNLATEFNQRFNQAEDPYKQRWLFERINEKVNEMYTHRLMQHNMNPEDIPIGKWLHSNGTEFKNKLEELRGQYAAQDMLGAKQYRGNLERLNKELKAERGLEHKRKVLKKFYIWWDSLMYREEDPFVRGAFRAYMKTKEGMVLLKTARKHTNRVNDAKYLKSR